MVGKKSKYHHIGLQVYIYESFASITAFNELLNIDLFSILLVNSGSIFLQIDDKEVTVFENELLIVSIRSSCEILSMSEQLQICLVSFTLDFIFENSIRIQHINYFGFYIRKLPPKIFIKNKNLPHLLFLFEQLYCKTRKSNNQIFKKEVLLLNFNLFLFALAEKYASYFQQLNENYTIKEKLLLHLFEILEMNCRKHHDVKYYAEALSMTPDNLTKIIKELTQKTAKQFIVEAVILEAKNLLRNEDLNISNISEELQFATYSSFSKFFKRHTSLSPSEYRTQLNPY